jgi:hypothetical protein
MMRSTLAVLFVSLQTILRLVVATGDHEAPKGCKINITSSGSLECPTGQLDDGQIRLQGPYEVAIYYFQANGGIIDAKGRGCIVTGSLKSLSMLVFCLLT